MREITALVPPFFLASFLLSYLLSFLLSPPSPPVLCWCAWFKSAVIWHGFPCMQSNIASGTLGVCVCCVWLTAVQLSWFTAVAEKNGLSSLLPLCLSLFLYFSLFLSPPTIFLMDFSVSLPPPPSTRRPAWSDKPGQHMLHELHRPGADTHSAVTRLLLVGQTQVWDAEQLLLGVWDVTALSGGDCFCLFKKMRVQLKFLSFTQVSFL